MQYDAVKEEVRRKAAVLHARAVESISKIDTQFQDRLRALLTSQAKDAAAHATGFASDLELSTIRGVPESARMRREACLTAKFGDFATAEQLYEQAEAAHEATLAWRHQQVADTHDRLDHRLGARHEEQLRLNRLKQQQHIGEVRLRYAIGIESLKRQLANAAFRWHITQNEAEEAKFFVPLSDGGGQRRLPSRVDSRSRIHPRFAHPENQTPRSAARPKSTGPVRKTPDRRP